MSVEFRLVRKDNKTVFDLGKRLSYDVLETVFSQEELLEFLLLWQIMCWERNADKICVFILRDRLLDFVEGASINDLKIETDHWDYENPEAKEYKFTHNRYISKEDSDQYYEALLRCNVDDYLNNPLKFFRESGIGKYKDLRVSK